jgi:hypothetical protein
MTHSTVIGTTADSGLSGTWPANSGTLPLTGLSVASSSLYAFSNSSGVAPGNVSAGVLALTGANADISINGVSLMTVLQGIQERLNMLTPNRTLEAEWDQLRELGDQYRKLESQLLEKQRMWSQLSARRSQNN